MVEHQSFSSPFTVQTLDQIPTPILKLLVGLGPFLKQVSWCVDIVLWRAAQPRMSVLAVLFWIIGCLWTWQVIGFGLPSLILYKLAKDWLQVRTSRARREKLEKARQELRQKRLEELRRNGDEDDEDDERARKMQLQQQDEEDELIMRKIRPDGQVSLDDTIQHVANINQFIDYVGSATKNLFMYVDGTQPELTVSLLSVCLYLFPIWIVVSWLLGASGVFCIVGTLALISPSPWFKIIVSTLRHNLILTHLLTAIWAYGVAVMSYSLSCFKHQQQEVKRQTIKSRFYAIIGRAKVEKQKAMDALKADAEEEEQENKGTRSEMIFQFEVYENQRWWLGVNWTTNMMPSERGAWTDSQLKAIPSKERFQLPVSSTTSKVIHAGKTTIQRTTNKVWNWADGDWWVDMTGEVAGKVDHNGWEYCNNAWKQQSGMPGIHTFTRRRRWCRRAKLVERESDTHISKEEADALKKQQ